MNFWGKTSIYLGVFAYFSVPVSACPQSYMLHSRIDDARSYCLDMLNNFRSDDSLVSNYIAEEPEFYILNSMEKVKHWDEGCGWKNYDLRAGISRDLASNHNQCTMALSSLHNSSVFEFAPEWLGRNDSKSSGSDNDIINSIVEIGDIEVKKKSWCSKDNGIRYDMTFNPHTSLANTSKKNMIYISMYESNCKNF